MQGVHILCPFEKLLAQVSAFEAQFAAQGEEATLLDYGFSQKRGEGYLVIEWLDEADEDFLAQLLGDLDILDFSVYSVPTLTEEQLHLLEQAELHEVNACLEQQSLVISPLVASHPDFLTGLAEGRECFYDEYVTREVGADVARRTRHQRLRT